MSAHMAHRHYGLRGTKPPRIDTGSAPSGAWSGGAFVGMILIILIVLGVVLYELSKIVSDTANTTTPAPSTVGQETQRP
jgi:hypothetical protein